MKVLKFEIEGDKFKAVTPIQKSNTRRKEKRERYSLMNIDEPSRYEGI